MTVSENLTRDRLNKPTCFESSDQLMNMTPAISIPSGLNPTQSCNKHSEALQEWLLQFADTVGLPCACVERQTQNVVIRTTDSMMLEIPAHLESKLGQIQDVLTYQRENGLILFIAPVPIKNELLVYGYTKASHQVVLSSRGSERLPICDRRTLDRLIRCAIRTIELDDRDSKYRQEINSLCQRIDQAQEQIGVLNHLNAKEDSFYESVEAFINRQTRRRSTDDDNVLMVGFVRSLVSTLDAKDPHTRGHSERVAVIARRIGERLELGETELNDLYLSSLLHDLGKIGVDDRILSKPDRLTQEEFNQIQQHPLIGFQILQPLPSLAAILPGVRNHHEAFNGKGYPDKLSGNDIPLMARIISVADSYDAMITDRPYRKGMPLEKVEEIFHRGSGEQWDPQMIDAYFAIRDDIRQLYEAHNSTSDNWLDQLGMGHSTLHIARARRDA